MPFQFRELTIQKIGVIGSGQIGPDIALYFTKVFAAHGVPVVVVDIDPDALQRGQQKLEKKVRKGIETGAFDPQAGTAMIENVTFTADYAALAGADWVIEAATENAAIKGKIFADVQSRCPNAILASNSSHLEPEAIFASLANRSRTLVIHYFFPAERNPLVEIVPGTDTAPAVVEALMGLYENIGKVPIRVGSRYGYAIDPIFEGLFLAAALGVEAGWGTTKEVDAVAKRALGLGVGPFTAMNLTGGNPITHHGLDVMHEKFGPWFRSPASMHHAIQTGQPWDVPGRGETVTLSEEREQLIADRMRGAYFGLVGQILDAAITTISDLEMGLELGLDIRPPFAMMNELGLDHSLELVRKYAAEFIGFPVPTSLLEQAHSGRPWTVEHVLRRDVGDVAVLTIRRPRVLNALNGEVFSQLHAHFSALRDDAAIRAVVLTGFGTKAFVSGADVNFLATIDSAETGAATSRESKIAGNLIESLGKPVIAALNGSAIGGGIELAMCCTARISRKGLKMAAAQPEVNLGIIPGAGGTQRLPRLIGIERAALMLRTGMPISSSQAVEWGLFHAEVDGDLIAAAIDLARRAADGAVSLPALAHAPMADGPSEFAEVDLGHRSRAIDAILCRTLSEGLIRPLSEGLEIESEMFGECCNTADMKIGIENFLKNGPRTPAVFTHA